MKSNNDFIPTWLYIKKHNQTGKKYFGKTIHDPYSYKGSGIVWTRHLKKHGCDVSTIWTRLFTDKKSLMEYATKFSIINRIVESHDWANLIIENGLVGGKIRNDYRWTDNQRKNHSAALRGRKQTPEHIKKRTSKQNGKLWINNGLVRKFVKLDYVTNYIENGFVIGDLPHSMESKRKTAISMRKLSLVWVKNENTNVTKRIPIIELQKYIDKGFTRGRIYPCT